RFNQGSAASCTSVDKSYWAGSFRRAACTKGPRNRDRNRTAVNSSQTRPGSILPFASQRSRICVCEAYDDLLIQDPVYCAIDQKDRQAERNPPSSSSFLTWQRQKTTRLAMKPQPCTSECVEQRRIETPRNEHELPRVKQEADGHLLCLDAFRIVLNDHDASEKRWFVSTVNLQMASVQFCVACRLARVYHVRIAAFSPWIVERDHKWEERHGGGGDGASEVPRLRDAASGSNVLSHHRDHSLRIPRLCLRRMTWELSTFTSDRQLAASMQRLAMVGDEFGADVREAMFPPLTQRLTFGRDFNRAIRSLSRGGCNDQTLSTALRGIAPPPASSLLELSFGSYFNEELDESVLLPSSIRRLTFGSGFNRPIDRIKWPPAIRDLVFGWRFNQDVQGVSFPSSLETLEFGFSFNQPVRGVCWPASLRQLSFGDMFSQDIGGDGTAGDWPEPLERLTFGDSFNPSNTAPIALPKRLVSLALGNGFNQPVDTISWPDSLRELQMGDSFNQPINRVRWPASLKRLTFGAGGSFNQDIDTVRWPQSLEVLEFGWKFNRSITRVEWPPSLRELSFGWDFDQAVVVEGVGVRWPASLQRLTFGQNFNQSLVTSSGGGDG
ncbi:unnamed protein product, partial [Scytosiphon promiscuus]